MLRARHAQAARAIVATLALGLALTAVACGGDDDARLDRRAAATTAAAAPVARPRHRVRSAAAGRPAAESTAAESTAAESTAPPPTEKVTIALDWTANVNYLGIYAAIANGYFEQQGIEPEILPYAGTPAEALIDAGKTDLADQLSARRHHQPGARPGVQGGGGRWSRENTTALAVLASIEVPEPEGPERQALRRLRHPERQGADPRDPEGRRRRRARSSTRSCSTRRVIDALAKDRMRTRRSSRASTTSPPRCRA